MKSDSTFLILKDTNFKLFSLAFLCRNFNKYRRDRRPIHYIENLSTIGWGIVVFVILEYNNSPIINSMKDYKISHLLN